MREFSTPAAPGLPTTGNLTDPVVENARSAAQRVALLRRATGRRWEEVSAATFLAEVSAVAKGLVTAGVAPGDRVAIVASTSYEWTLVDYAVWFAGAVSVPVYPSSTPDQVGSVLADADVRAVVAEGAAQVEAVTRVRAGLPSLQHLWSLQDDAVDVLARLGAGVTDQTLEERRRAASPADPATILYTSGTTGRPRGCVLTHGNFQAEIAGALGELGELFAAEDATTLLFLPLPHVFARIVAVGAVSAGVRLAHSPGIATLTEDLAAVRPTFLLGLPRVFERLFTTASQQATADGRGARFERGARVAIAWSRGLETGRAPVGVRAQHALFGRLLYPALRENLGGACRYAVSGGAPLGERLGHFYRGIGVPVLEGYGLTETTGALTANTPTALKVGTVGRPLPGVTVRVADDGELLFRGPQVFSGYWRDEAATREALDDRGWLRTGDLGEVDDEGFVRVIGRKQEILVTAGGKNVSPTVLEERVRAHPLVGQCLVVGDGAPFIAALVTLDADAAARWAVERARSPRLADLAVDPEVRLEVATAVEDANRAVSRAEAIRSFTVLPVEWTEESGHLTPSLKLRRSHVLRQCRDEIARLYAR